MNNSVNNWIFSQNYCESQWSTACPNRLAWHLPQAFVPTNNMLIYQKEFLACITTTFHLTWLYTIDCILNGHRYGIILDMMVNGKNETTDSKKLWPSPIFIEYVRTLNQVMSVFLLWGIAKTAMCVVANLYSLNTRQVRTGHSSKFMNFMFLVVVPLVSVFIQRYKPIHLRNIGLALVLTLKFMYPFEEFPDAIHYASIAIFWLGYKCAKTIKHFIHRFRNQKKFPSGKRTKISESLKCEMDRKEIRVQKCLSLAPFQTLLLSDNDQSELDKDEDSALKNSNSNLTQNSISASLPLDIVYLILDPKNELSFQDIVQLRLLNRHWSLITAKHVMSKIAIPISFLSTPHIQKCFLDYGFHISSLALKGSYDPLYDDAILRALSHTPMLRSLQIRNMYSHILTIQIAQKCPNIQYLDVNIGHSLIERIRFNPMVRWFKSIAQNFSRKDGQALTPVSPIQSQSMTSSPFFDLRLQSLKKLNGANLSGYIHTGRQLCESFSCQQYALTSLNLNHCSKLSHISKVLEFFPNLKNLNLSYSRIETLEMSYMLQLIFTKRSNVENLNLANVKPDVARAVTIFGVQLLPDLRRMDPAAFNNNQSSLKVLNISNAKSLRFEEVVALMAAFPGLTSLNMRGCRKVNLQAFAWLIDTCEDLEELHLTDCHPALNDPEFTLISLPVTPPPIFYSLHIKGYKNIQLFRSKLGVLINTVQMEQMAGGPLETHIRIVRSIILILLLLTLASLLYALILFVHF